MATFSAIYETGNIIFPQNNMLIKLKRHCSHFAFVYTMHHVNQTMSISDYVTCMLNCNFI